MSARRLLAAAAVTLCIATPLTLAADAADADYLGPSSRPQSSVSTFTPIAANTNGEVASAVASKRYRVWGFTVSNRGTGAQSFRFGAASTASGCSGTVIAKTADVLLAANGVYTAESDTVVPLFEGSFTGFALCLMNGGTSATWHVQLRYTTFNPSDQTWEESGGWPTEVSNTPTFNVGNEPVDVACTTGCDGGGAGSGEVEVTAISDPLLADFKQDTNAGVVVLVFWCVLSTILLMVLVLKGRT